MHRCNNNKNENNNNSENTINNIWKGRILGGEAAMWAEHVSPGTIVGKIFPRASAYGGRLWNYGSGSGVPAGGTFWVDAELGLAALASRMVERGVDADFIMPQYCQDEPAMCFPRNSSSAFAASLSTRAS